MPRDQRDPQVVGEVLIHLIGQERAQEEEYRRQGRAVDWYASAVCRAADTLGSVIIRPFDATGPIEKYGRPQDIPTTPW